MKTLFQRIALMGAAFAVLHLAGCASPADREAMIPQAVAVAKKHPYSVSVEAKGGAETAAMDSSNISNADLKAALEGAIVKTGVFKNVVQGKNGDYDLTVSVIEMPKPIFGLTFTVDLEMAWSLVKRSDQSVAMRKSIKSTHTATFSDAAVAVTRLRLAVEGAARSNISQGIQAISELNLLSPDFAVPAEFIKEVPERGAKALAKLAPSESTPGGASPPAQAGPASAENQIPNGESEGRRLTGDELAQHFANGFKVSARQDRGRNFVLKVSGRGNIERDCMVCNVPLGHGTLKVDTGNNTVCMRWFYVTYPESTCFSVYDQGKGAYILRNAKRTTIIEYRLSGRLSPS